jgi:hypothetical protein
MLWTTAARTLFEYLSTIRSRFSGEAEGPRPDLINSSPNVENHRKTATALPLDVVVDRAAARTRDDSDLSQTF